MLIINIEIYNYHVNDTLKDLQCRICTQHWAALWSCYPSTLHILNDPSSPVKINAHPSAYYRRLIMLGFNLDLQYYFLFLTSSQAILYSSWHTLSELSHTYLLSCLQSCICLYNLSLFFSCKYPIHFSNINSFTKSYLFLTPNRKWTFSPLSPTILCLYLGYKILPSIRIIGSFDWTYTRQ